MRKVVLLAAMAVLCLLYLRLACTPAPRFPASGTIPVLNETEVTELMKTPTVKELTAAMEKLRPLHEKISPPGPSDWLARHDEPGQTFKEYLASDPVTLKGKRKKIYILPLGEFTKTQRKIVNLTAEFMGLYFNAAVEVQKDEPLSIIPAEARRFHPTWRDKDTGARIPQILSTYVLYKLLKPRLPDDAVAYIAFTTSDLWPGENWNFVFGQASIREHVGVWSIYRFGKPELDEEEFRRTLLRTMKTGTHELGHMFSMYHCILYECNMCGSNNMEESDRRPVWLCPECLAKTCWATGVQPAARFRKLAEFCKKHGFTAEQEFYERSVKELVGK